MNRFLAAPLPSLPRPFGHSRPHAGVGSATVLSC